MSSDYWFPNLPKGQWLPGTWAERQLGYRHLKLDVSTELTCELGRWRSRVGSAPAYCLKDRRFESRQLQLFELMTLRWFNVLRSTCTLNHLTDCRQASKLDQLGIVQCTAINTHGNKFFHYCIRIINYSYIPLSGGGSFKPWCRLNKTKNTPKVCQV
jgi:hypothetical protein